MYFPCLSLREIPQCCGDNHNRIVRIWITCETDHMGTWSLWPIVDGMDCCSPNGSVGSGAMGKLWPICAYGCTKLQKSWKRRTAHLCKTLCSLETNHQNVLTKCGHAVSELGNVKWITDVKPLNYIITLIVIQNAKDVYQKLIATATCLPFR